MPIVGEVTTKKLTAEEMERWRKAQEDSGWLREHWSEILNEYAGKSIVVAGGELFVDDDVREALNRARQKHPDRIPLVRYIPSYRGKWIR